MVALAMDIIGYLTIIYCQLVYFIAVLIIWVFKMHLHY